MSTTHSSNQIVGDWEAYIPATLPQGRSWTGTTKILGCPVCPDLLSYEDIGVADNLRGRVVRLFFWLIRWWRP